jgi:hypothetical protein
VGGPPDPAQAGVRVSLGQAGLPVTQQADERLGQGGHVGYGQVEALGSGRRHDVRGVAGEEQPPVLHGRGDEAAHRRDGLLRDRALLQVPSGYGQPVLQLVPDPVVGPPFDVLVGGHLQVEPADLRRAHGVQREPVLVPGVDELVGRRRHRGQDAEPGVRVTALGYRHQAGRHGIAADAVESVAAGDRVAGDLVPRPGRVGEAEDGPGRVELGHLGIGDLELDPGPGRQPGRDRVLDDLGLGVDRHPAPAGQVTEVEVVPLPLELQVDPAVLEAFGVHPGAEADRAEQLDRPGFEQAGPLPRLAVGPAAVLDHDRVDAAQGQQVGKKQAGRPGSDDADLGALAHWLPG